VAAGGRLLLGLGLAPGLSPVGIVGRIGLLDSFRWQGRLGFGLLLHANGFHGFGCLGFLVGHQPELLLVFLVSQFSRVNGGVLLNLYNLGADAGLGDVKTGLCTRELLVNSLGHALEGVGLVTGLERAHELCHLALDLGALVACDLAHGLLHLLADVGLVGIAHL